MKTRKSTMNSQSMVFFVLYPTAAESLESCGMVDDSQMWISVGNVNPVPPFERLRDSSRFTFPVGQLRQRVHEFMREVLFAMSHQPSLSAPFNQAL